MLNNKIGKEEIRNSIKSVGLNPDDKKHVGKFSLGMMQRLGLAQAIMEDPDLLILDEPMNGLDKDGVKDMRQYLLDLKSKGKTILIASHSAEDIDVLCDTVCEMDKGKLENMKHSHVFMRFPGGKAKAVTFSFDDGVVEDAWMVEML